MIDTNLNTKCKIDYISDFKSITDASRKTNINKTSIGKVCRLEEKTAGGYIWKYID